MPIVSGGGAGGPAAGSYLPVGTKAGVALDTTTYSDTVRGGGAKLRTLVFTGEGAALALAMAGDAFPRLFLTSDPTDAIFYGGDGTADPESGNGVLVLNANGSTQVAGWNASASVALGAPASGGRAVRAVFNTGVEISAAVCLFGGIGAPTIGAAIGDLYVRVDGANGTLILYQCTVAGTAGNATWVPVLTPGSPVGIVTSGALSTVQLVTATGAQILTTRDAETITPFTGDGTNNAATCAIAISPDNSTYSTVATISIAAALNLTGVLTDTVNARVPAGWYLKLTVSHGTLGLTTYY